ncbi:MAG TPA: GNAT family N-acetyltransferase [Terracidiphilus sp.]|jgi:GNAT superfamily N-acetyltransferase|nr:GNAT family N-acetyltransferase [Terracidiphilus sp.]
MADIHSLDNPIWNSLTTSHAGFALGSGLARRYPTAIGPLSGIAEESDAACDDLRTLAGPGGILVLFLPRPFSPREGWTLVREGPLTQMICLDPPSAANALLQSGATMRTLTASDVPAMVALAELTEPGPFRERTHELGLFLGIFEDDRLVSMAGQRTRSPGFVEVSAVCTHPDARGKGYARTLMLAVMDDIRRGGATSYLHAWAHNHSAIRVYRDLGFIHRHTLHVAALRNDR